MTSAVVEVSTSPAEVRARRRPPQRWEAAWWGVAGIAVLIALWLVVRWLDLVPESGLPGPTAVFSAIFDIVGDGQFRDAYYDTLVSWAKSLVLATVFAVSLGLAVGWVPWLARSVSVPMHIGRSVPATTLIPVAIVLFGLGPSMKIATVTFSMTWLVLMNTIYGVRTIDRVTVLSARSMRFGRLDIIRRVLIPSALPSVMTGIRVAAGVGFVVTLSTELLGASSGVGTVMLLYQNAERPDFVYAGVIVVAFTGMVITYGVQWIEHLIVPWRPQRRAKGRG